MKNDIKELIKYEYENGTSMSKLAKKYDINISNIKKWSSQGKWVKKKQNKVTEKKSNRTGNGNREKTVTLNRETQIKKDIIDNVPKDEVMKKYDISEITYYRKSKSIRQMRLEATEKQAQAIINEVYADLPDFLRNIAIAKRNTAIRIIKTINNENSDDKEITKLEKKLNLIMKTEKEIMRTGKMLTTYETLEIEAQLSEENLQQQKLEIEKNKNSIPEEYEQVVILDDTDKD